MPRIDDITGLPRKEYPIFLLVEKTDNANTVIKIHDLFMGIRSALFKMQSMNPDVEIKVGLYTFSAKCFSVHPEMLVPLEDLDDEIINNNYSVDLTSVLDRLSEDLSRSTLLISETGYVVPNIILVIDGSKKYSGSDALSNLNNNRWFRYARKIALYVNERDLNGKDVICEFTGSEEAILKVTDISSTMDVFTNLLLCTSISGSILANHSRSVNDAIVFVDPIEEDAWDDDENW